jgi:ectoine hydroxylase-related dioxygenase (phytanoyl-CoA dioxygenase family)
MTQQATKIPINLTWSPLADADIRQFDDEGYLIVREVLDPETVDRLIEVSDRLIASDRRENRQLSHNSLYDGFRNCIAIDDAFIPLLTQQRILSAVVQLLGAHLQLMTSHLIYKHPDPPGTPDTVRSPGWHRDYANATKVLGNGVPRILLKCAYYLTDLSEPNSGATLVVPGSNQLLKPIEIPAGQTDPAGTLEPSLQPGDCLLFENRIWHAGAANLSGRIRKAVMFGYGYRWVMPMDYRTQSPTLLDKLDPLGQYLVGEPFKKTQEYRPGGGESPLAAWCEAHGALAVRPSC